MSGFGTHWKQSKLRLLQRRMVSINHGRLPLQTACLEPNNLFSFGIADVSRPIEEAVPAAVATNQPAVTSPEAKTSRLLPEQEQVLLRFFGAQDKVDREEALALASQVCLYAQRLLPPSDDSIPMNLSHGFIIIIQY